MENESFYITKRPTGTRGGTLRVFLPADWGFDPGDMVVIRVHVHGRDAPPLTDTRKVASASGRSSVCLNRDWELDPDDMLDVEVTRYAYTGAGSEKGA